MNNMDNVFEDNSFKGFWVVAWLMSLALVFHGTRSIYQEEVVEMQLSTMTNTYIEEPMPVMSLMEAVARLESICIRSHNSLCVFLFDDVEYEETLYDMQMGRLQEVTLDYVQHPIFKYFPQSHKNEMEST